jgi:hypothetical protein
MPPKIDKIRDSIIESLIPSLSRKRAGNMSETISAMEATALFTKMLPGMYFI